MHRHPFVGTAGGFIVRSFRVPLLRLEGRERLIDSIYGELPSLEWRLAFGAFADALKMAQDVPRALYPWYVAAALPS